MVGRSPPMSYIPSLYNPSYPPSPSHSCLSLPNMKENMMVVIMSLSISLIMIVSCSIHLPENREFHSSLYLTKSTLYIHAKISLSIHLLRT